MSLSIIIIIITVLVSVSAFSRRDLTEKLLFSPYRIRHHREGYRFLSYGLIHADFIHLFVNMWVLYIFGDVVESALLFTFEKKGLIYFIILYVGGLAFSTLFSYGRYHSHPAYTAVGASGAVSSVVFAYILLLPTTGLMIFPFPFSIPAWAFGLLYLMYSWFMARRGRDNIGHDAHFFGALYGLGFMIMIQPSLIESFYRQLF